MVKKKKKKMRKNPPKGAVEIYDRIFSIEAKKSKKSGFPKENFRHDFQSGSAIYGLPNGDLLIKSKKGKRLWKIFDYPDDDR